MVILFCFSQELLRLFFLQKLPFAISTFGELVKVIMDGSGLANNSILPNDFYDHLTIFTMVKIYRL